MNILNTINHILQSWGVPTATANAIDNTLAFLLIALVALLADVICRRCVLPAIGHLVKRTKATWDDILFSPRVMTRISHIVAPLVAYMLLPIAFPEPTAGGTDLLRRILLTCVQLGFLWLIDALLRAVYQVYSAHEALRGRPVKGLLQTSLVICWFVGLVIVIGTLINQSPWALLTGLGASAAILMLVFKDSIMGFVSGVQLSANDMLKVGDWIKMPKHGADGIVTEVTLATVKVRNWDNTVTTIPPYALVSDSFENWQAMRDSGGRRIKRSINIDVNTVCFCTPEMLERFSAIPLLKPYLERMQGQQITNLGVLRAYLVAYLGSLPVVSQDLHCMVRQLQPTAQGVPLELYCFSTVKDWVPYEGIQSDIFDHVLAIVPRFGLRIFQAPSGLDLQRLEGNSGPYTTKG